MVQKAKDALQAAEKIRESAELAMKNSGDAVLKQQAAEAEQEVKSAENDLAAISDRVDLANRMWEQGKISKAHKVAEELAFQKAKFAIELIQTKRMLLQDQTRPRILKTLKSDLEKASSDERICQAALKPEKAAEDQLQEQVDACRIVVPRDGNVMHDRPDRATSLLDAEVLSRGELERLRDALTRQQIAVQAAEARNRDLGNQLEIAEMTLHEYTEGGWLVEHARAELEIKGAQSQVCRAVECVEWAKKMILKGLLAMPEKVLAERRLEDAKADLEHARKALLAFTNGAKVRTILALRDKIERRRAEKWATEMFLRLERARETRLQQEIDRTEALVAKDGEILKARQTAATGSNTAPLLQAGSLIRYGQTLVRVVPTPVSQ